MGKVLILDDDEAIVEGLTMALEDEGLSVVGTTSPFYLPFLLRRERPDVVLIDLGMPTLRGERVFQALTPALRGTTRFLVFSGRTDADLAAVAKETGAADFIHKGDDFGAIVRRIKFWVSLSTGTSAPRLEPHVAVISNGTGEAADVLRAAGYFVTHHAPGEVPSDDIDAIVIGLERSEERRRQRSRHRDHLHSRALHSRRDDRAMGPSGGSDFHRRPHPGAGPCGMR